MPRHHAGLVEAFGARGPDIIEVENFEHRGAHDAQVDRQEDQPERQRRQHQMAGDVEDAPDAGPNRADVLEAAGRQPLQIDREHDDRHQPEPERGRGVEDEAERRDQRVRPAVDAARGDHAEQQPEEERKGQRRGHQQDGRRQPLQDHRRHRLAVDRGEAEIEPHQPPEIIAELGRDREVEPVEFAQLPRGRGVAAAHLRHHRIDGIARRELQQQEHADQDQNQGRDRGGEPPPRKAKDAHDAYRGGYRRHAESQRSCQLVEPQRGVLEWLRAFAVITVTKICSIGIQTGSSVFTSLTNSA